MAVSRPQPWSLIGLATSIPSAWGGHGGGHVVGHKIQLGPPPSAAGCTGDLGRRQREDLPATARIDRPRPQHFGQGGPGGVGVVAVQVSWAPLMVTASLL
jgi:hypothetical protein